MPVNLAEADRIGLQQLLEDNAAKHESFVGDPNNDIPILALLARRNADSVRLQCL